MEYVRRNAFCLKCDVSKFYPSVDHAVLLDIIRRKIKCPDTLWLIEDIVNSFPGGKNVPIGNFTSQWMGNLYLNELDHYVKGTLKIRDYVRYCDDFLLFHNDKAVLRDAAKLVEEFVGERLKMRLSKCDLFPVSRGVDFFGVSAFSGLSAAAQEHGQARGKTIEGTAWAFGVWKDYAGAVPLCAGKCERVDEMGEHPQFSTNYTPR